MQKLCKAYVCKLSRAVYKRQTKQRARLDRLEALKNGTAPVTDAVVEMDSVETRMGKKTVELHHVTKQYGERTLFEDFNYIVLKNQRLGIIGENGCGKSTLLKMMAGKVQPDSGVVEVGETIRMGYFAQEVPDMDSDRRVIDYIRDKMCIRDRCHGVSGGGGLCGVPV